MERLKPRVFWVAKQWKRWLREHGKIDMFITKQDCEQMNRCDAVKIRIYIDTIG